MRESRTFVVIRVKVEIDSIEEKPSFKSQYFEMCDSVDGFVTFRINSGEIYFDSVLISNPLQFRFEFLFEPQLKIGLMKCGSNVPDGMHIEDMI